MNNEIKRKNIITVLSFISIILVCPIMFTYLNNTVSDNIVIVLCLISFISSGVLVLLLNLKGKVYTNYILIPICITLGFNLYKFGCLLNGTNQMIDMFYFIYYILTLVVVLVAVLYNNKLLNIAVLLLIGCAALAYTYKYIDSNNDFSVSRISEILLFVSYIICIYYSKKESD